MRVNFNSCEFTCSNLCQRVDLHNEVLLQEEEAHNGEEVHKDESEQCREQDGAPVTRHAVYHI